MLVLVLRGAKDEGGEASVLGFWCKGGPKKPVPFKLANDVTEAVLVEILTVLLLLRIIGVVVVDTVEKAERLLGAMKEVVLARVADTLVEMFFDVSSEDTVDEVLTAPEGEPRFGCVETRAATLLPLELVSVKEEV